MIWQLAFALLAFAYACRFYKPDHVRALTDDKVSRAQSRRAPRVVAAGRDGHSSASLNNVQAQDQGDVGSEAEEEHEIDRIRREMGLGFTRARPPHLDIRSRSGYASGSAGNGVHARQVLREQERIKDRPKAYKPPRRIEPYCQPCAREFRDQYSLEQHNITRHSESRSSSSGRSASTDQLEVLVDTSCEICERTFESVVSLQQHRAASHKGLFGCLKCKLNFKKADEARLHFRRLHSGRLSPSSDPSSSPSQSRRASNSYFSNPTLKDTVFAAEPDPTLPELQRTYGCDQCHERFPTVEDRDEHLASPFAHGDESALAAAFPPLGPIGRTESDASPIKESPEAFPPLIAAPSPVSDAVDNPVDPPLPDFPVSSLDSLAPVAAESLSGSDFAIDLDQPLPSFAFDSGSSAPSSVAADLATPDESDGEVVPSQYRWGEIIEGPVPPGIEAFPELPSKPTIPLKLETPATRWHTNEKPNFAVPDLTPKPMLVDTLYEGPEDPRPWSEQYDDEYADELPSDPIGMPPPLSGSNNVPLGTRQRSSASPNHPRTSTPRRGQGNRPPPASRLQHDVPTQSDSDRQHSSSASDTSASLSGSDRITIPALTNNKYPYPLPARPSSQDEGDGQIIFGQIEEQVPNFAYAPPGADFNAFSGSALGEIDAMGPRPAPVKAQQPSAWSIPAQVRLIRGSGSPKPELPKVWGQPTGLGSLHSKDWSPSTRSPSRSHHDASRPSAITTPTKTTHSAGPGINPPRPKWADRKSAHPAKELQPHFESDGWTTSVPVKPQPRSRGGRAVVETAAERYAREAQARKAVEAERVRAAVAAGEDDPYGGW